MVVANKMVIDTYVESTLAESRPVKRSPFNQ